ncbi:uncharacterized protein STEHIDRAFT_159604 [Stereum hirsutum FP-91666 SS1]|uniref:uncharacterized protein n=1 Tax=Stereum hirsutum (strain FP-91666) TaxID=721885 RepID=UPI00044497E0|nr:uncharacterized protein STEHIDRAFT_159604 [Stereum hirsutum FP-91666 SS1]EIM83998.1 hypothetical protein STEHIDRAFT_159604 [Stereum hirsutum FP-91666 SS1]
MKIALYTLASEEQLWQDLDELWQRMHAGCVALFILSYAAWRSSPYLDDATVGKFCVVRRKPLWVISLPSTRNSFWLSWNACLRATVLWSVLRLPDIDDLHNNNNGLAPRPQDLRHLLQKHSRTHYTRKLGVCISLPPNLLYELRLDSLHERNNIYPSVTVQHYLHQPYTIPPVNPRDKNVLSDTKIPDGFEKSHLYTVLLRLVSGSLLPIVFDTMVILLTIKRTLRHTVDMRRMQQHSITQLILRDGLLYYASVLSPSGTNDLDKTDGLTPPPFTAHCTTSLTPAESNPKDTMFSRDFAKVSLGSSVPTFFTVLPSMLVNRLVLNLRQFEPSGHRPSTSRTWGPPVSAPALDEQGPPHIRIGPSKPIYNAAVKKIAGNSNSELCISRPETRTAMKTANTRTTLASMGYSLPIALAFDGEESFLEDLPSLWGPSDEEDNASGTR